MSKKEIENEQETINEKKLKKQGRKVNKSRLAIKVVATFLTLAMVLPIVASTIFYIMGE